jgi:hypothetical protein
MIRMVRPSASATSVNDSFSMTSARCMTIASRPARFIENSVPDANGPRDSMLSMPSFQEAAFSKSVHSCQTDSVVTSASTLYSDPHTVLSPSERLGTAGPRLR